MNNKAQKNILNDINPIYNDNSPLIVFSTDDNYVKYLGVTLTSLVKNISPDKNYDIVILDGGISPINIHKLSTIAKGYDNVSIRFFDILAYTQKHKDKFYTTAHFTEAMYYRIFITDIAKKYNKAIYLDCDIIVQSDITKLSDIDLGQNLVGAIKDCGDKKLYNYIKKELPLINPENYFNSGVMIFDINLCKQNNFIKKCLDLLAIHNKLKYPDQDILNLALKDKVYFLPFVWNYRWGDFIASEYVVPLKTDYPIIHYTSGLKPWLTTQIPLSEIFWEYARFSPFYENICAHFWKQPLPFENFFLTIIKCFCFGKIKKKIKQKIKMNKFKNMIYN